MSATDDYYVVLRVAPEASTAAIRAAYRALMRRYHPDVNASEDAVANGSIGDNRGGIDAQQVKFSLGRAGAAKIVLTPISDDKGGRKLRAGFAVDRTTGSRERSFNLATAVALAPIGGARRATQQAIRTGFNYNLPYANKLASLHVEYGHSMIAGPDAIITDRRSVDEVRIGIRVSLQQYVRH